MSTQVHRRIFNAETRKAQKRRESKEENRKYMNKRGDTNFTIESA